MSEIPHRLHDRCNVIVVMYNSSPTLEANVRGLSANASSVAEAVYVDNGSRDGSAREVEVLLEGSALTGKVLRSDNTGFAGGHWAARNAFSNPRLPTLCLNPDVELSPGVLAAMLRVLAGAADETAIVTAPLIGPGGALDSASKRRLPSITTGALYSVFGKLLPRSLRYNAVDAPSIGGVRKIDGIAVEPLEATTGALMLVNPAFVGVEAGIFDRDYFMYGEDLQLCNDARRVGMKVFMAQVSPSTHIKGVSSGWPRSWRSNRAFHEAMYIYYSKNLAKSKVDAAIVRVAVWARLGVSGLAAGLSRRLSLR